jgi:hypothetical protein
LQLKARWSSVVRDPQKALTALPSNMGSMSLISHLPKDKIDKIVTDKVLKMDQQGCKTILDKMYQDKK